MKRITFEQFIETFNFRDVYENNKKEIEYDSKIIRIHIPTKDILNPDLWFEFGINEFTCEKEKILNYVLSREIKKTFIETISIKNEENYGYIEIWLIDEEICK